MAKAISSLFSENLYKEDYGWCNTVSLSCSPIIWQNIAAFMCYLFIYC